jgi:hypothetical protein
MKFTEHKSFVSVRATSVAGFWPCRGKATLPPRKPIATAMWFQEYPKTKGVVKSMTVEAAPLMVVLL